MTNKELLDLFRGETPADEWYNLKEVDAIMDMVRQDTIQSFCEQVNDLACENMLKPPYKLEGQHKRAMVILCKQLNIPLTFEDDVK